MGTHWKQNRTVSRNGSSLYWRRLNCRVAFLRQNLPRDWVSMKTMLQICSEYKYFALRIRFQLTGLSKFWIFQVCAITTEERMANCVKKVKEWISVSIKSIQSGMSILYLPERQKTYSFSLPHINWVIQPIKLSFHWYASHLHWTI